MFISAPYTKALRDINAQNVVNRFQTLRISRAIIEYIPVRSRSFVKFAGKPIYGEIIFSNFHFLSFYCIVLEPDSINLQHSYDIWNSTIPPGKWSSSCCILFLFTNRLQLLCFSSKRNLSIDPTTGEPPSIHESPQYFQLDAFEQQVESTSGKRRWANRWTITTTFLIKNFLQKFAIQLVSCIKRSWPRRKSFIRM